jgi:hypothetical protein
MRDLSFQLISTLINERIVMSFMALHSMKLIYFPTPLRLPRKHGICLSFTINKPCL